MGFLEWYEERNKNKTVKKTESKQGNTTAQGFIDWYDERNNKFNLEKTIKLNTLQSDLTNTIKSIDSAYNGWQTRETMENTLSSVQSMYDRLGKYQEYQKQYGGTDLSDVLGGLESALGDLENLSRSYSAHKSAKTYDNEKNILKELGNMSSSDAKDAMLGIPELEDKLKTAKEYESKIQGLRAKQRNRGEYTDRISETENELSKYLESIGYKSTRELENTLTRKKIAYTTAGGENITWQSLYDTKKSKEDNDALYKEISSREDFEKYKNDGANAEKNKVEYSIKNKSQLLAKDMFNPGIKKSKDGELYYAEVTGNERDLYNYHLGRELSGLAKEGTADEYLNSIYNALKDRHENKVISALSEYTDEHPVFASGISVGQNLFAGAEYLKDSVNYKKTGELDTNHLSKASSAIRSTVSQKVDWEIGKWDAFDFLYNTGMSGVDSAVAMATFGGAGGAALGLSAAAQGTNDALERGLDNKSAFWSGFSSGVFEALFESVSIGNFKALKDAPVDGIKSVIKNIGKSMLTNASEETLTELANIAYDYFANGDLSQAETDIRAYMSAGMSEREAIKKVALEQGARVVGAGASGALMGFGFGGVAGVSAYGQSRSIGKNIKSNERVQDLFDITSIPEVGEAYEIYTRYANKGINADNITNAQLGRLYTKAKTDAIKTMQSKKSTGEQKSYAMQTLGQLSVVDTENAIKKEASKLNVGEETKITETDEAINIKDLKVKGDKVTVATEKGEISVDDITLTQNDAEMVALVNVITKSVGEDAANMFVAEYDENIDINDYSNSFNLAMLYAKGNFDFDTILNKKGPLSTDIVKAIYKATVINEARAKETAIQNLVDKQSDTVFAKGKFDDSIIDYNSNTKDGSKVNWNTLSLRQRQAVKFAQLFSKATGVNIKFIKSEVVKGKHKGENGSYNPDTNTIEIDVYAGIIDVTTVKDSIIPTLSHEITHWMKDKSPMLYNSIREDIMKTLAERKGQTSEELIDNEIARLNKNHPDKKHTADDAIDEIVARACEDMLSNSNEARKLLNKMSASEQQGFIEKIKETFDNLIQWINDLLAYYKSNSAEAKLLSEYKADLKRISKQWDEMLKQAIKANQALEKNGAYNNKNTSNDSVKLSDRDYDYWLDKIETISDEDALKARSEITYLRIADSTPNILQKYGAMNLPIIIRFDAMYLAQRGSGAFEGHYHHLGKKVMENLLDFVSNPDAILKTVTTNKKGDEVVKLVALVSVPIKSGEALASIEINTVKDRGKGDELYNLVVTFFDYKENYLRNLFVKYGAETMYKKETLSQDNPKLHEWLGTIEESVSKDSVPNPKEKVNTKFSDREETTVYDLMGERDRLLKENEQLDADARNLNNIIGSEEVANKRFLSLASYLKKLSGSNIESVSLAKKLKEAYSNMQSAKSLSWIDVATITNGIAESLMSRNLDVPVDYFKNVMYEIRKEKISLSDEQRTRMEKQFGGYSNFHKYVFGRANITKYGTSLSSAWKNWSKKYPSLFDASLQGVEQIDALVELITTLKTTNTILSEYEYSEAVRHLSTEIYNQFWNIAAESNTDGKSIAYRKEHMTLMGNLRNDYEKRQKDMAVHPVGETALKYENLLKKVQERKKKEIARAKELGKQRLDKYKENAERKTRIQSITANALTLKKWLTKNSKDYHIHEAMKGPVIKLLNALDFSSKSMLEEGLPTTSDITFTEAFADIKTMLENAANMVEGLQELYGHDLAEQIDLLCKATYRLVGDNNYVINAMTVEELKSLDKLIREIKKTVTDLNKFHVLNHDKGAVNLGNEFMVYGDKLGNLEKQHGTLGKFFEFRNRTPYYFFKDLGPVGQKLFEAFQNGWDKLAFNAKRVIDFANETYKSEEVKKWSNEIKEFTIAQLDGSERTFKMSIAQIMALYCVSKQKDAQTHLLSGGMTLKRIDKKGHVVTDYENITLTISDIQSILATLNERQREVADKLQEFMNTVCSAWGNEISMARFGIEMFNIPDYFPIKVSEATTPNDNTKEIDNASLFRLLNMSFTNARKLGAGQSIEIGDIFDIFAQHSSDMAKYNALALPVLDFNKFYSIQGKDSNNKEYGVVKTLKSVFGDEANGYIRRFVRDLNGSQNVSRDAIGNTFFKNAKVASVAANLRVVLLQPTAFYKASAVMDNKYLLKASAYIKVEPVGMVRKLKKAIADAEKHCGIVQWKALGYYDTDISKGITEKIKHADTFKDKAIEKSLKLAEIADKVTFGTLWVACDFEIRDTRKDLKVGSEEFYNAIANRLREVIYATQVVDSTMTRSDMMRSADGRDKMLTAFGSEPTIAYNMLLDMVTQYKRDKQVFGKVEARKRNSKKIRKVVTAYVITNAVAALIESGFDVLRDDDDEEMDVAEFIKLYFKNFAFDMSIGNKLPYIKDIYSFMQGYSSSRIDTQWIQSINYVMKDIKKAVEGEGDISKLTKDTLKAMSYISGLPAYNVYRDLMAVLDKLGILDD